MKILNGEPYYETDAEIPSAPEFQRAGDAMSDWLAFWTSPPGIMLCTLFTLVLFVCAFGAFLLAVREFMPDVWALTIARIVGETP